jgi:hypothetical protein
VDDLDSHHQRPLYRLTLSCEALGTPRPSVVEHRIIGFGRTSHAFVVKSLQWSGFTPQDLG